MTEKGLGWFERRLTRRCRQMGSAEGQPSLLADTRNRPDWHWDRQTVRESSLETAGGSTSTSSSGNTEKAVGLTHRSLTTLMVRTPMSLAIWITAMPTCLVYVRLAQARVDRARGRFSNRNKEGAQKLRVQGRADFESQPDVAGRQSVQHRHDWHPNTWYFVKETAASTPSPPARRRPGYFVKRTRQPFERREGEKDATAGVETIERYYKGKEEAGQLLCSLMR